MDILKLKLTGTVPLMMHSDRLANPLLSETKAHKSLTSKRKKTDDDHLAIARSEFVSGLYFNEKIGVFIPGQNFDATFLAGAKLQKLGTAWKRGALVMTDRAKLIYDGPKTPEKLWDDTRFIDCRGVKVGTAKIMRYRPVFMEWAVDLEIAFNSEILDEGEVKKALSDAGALIGVASIARASAASRWLMDDGSVTMLPEWRQAVKDFLLSDFKCGDIIPHAWLESHFGMAPLDDSKPMLPADWNARQFVWMGSMEAFRADLLETHQVFLSNVFGQGYRVVPPREQTSVAQDKFEREAKKSYRSAATILKCVKVSELTEPERKENIDAIAKLAMLRGMHKTAVE